MYAKIVSSISLVFFDTNTISRSISKIISFIFIPTWLHQWSRTSGMSQCWALEPTRGGRTRIRNVLAAKYIDLVGMNTANGAQAQIWNFVPGGNQEWELVRIDPDTAQSGKRAEEAKDPQPTPSQRKHQNDLVHKLNNAGKGRAGRKA